MSGEREVMLAAGRAALERLQHAHEVAAQDEEQHQQQADAAIGDGGMECVVNEVQQHTGERLLVRRPALLDASFADLAAMEAQTEHYAAAMALVRQWMHVTDTRSLGSVLKVIPAQVAHEITDHLRAAGVLADGGARLSP